MYYVSLEHPHFMRCFKIFSCLTGLKPLFKTQDLDNIQKSEEILISQVSCWRSTDLCCVLALPFCGFYNLKMRFYQASSYIKMLWY
jgi:hypothetical protein